MALVVSGLQVDPRVGKMLVEVVLRLLEEKTKQNRQKLAPGLRNLRNIDAIASLLMSLSWTLQLG